MLVLDGVAKRYDSGRWVLRDVDLELVAGQATALVGDNGSGKSTLLRILVGVSRPTHGTVTGRPRVVGYVPDRFPPGERLSALAYLTHLGRVRGLRTRVALARATDLVERLALVGGRDAPLRTLSKGNAQKVALAQALLVRPELLVLDEPWSGLDATAHHVLAEIIAEVAAAGSTVVFTDHREAVTRAHASRGYRVESGQVTGVLADEPLVDVVLTPTARGVDTDWRAHAGVLAVAHRPDGVSIQVTPGSSDALLAVALDRGWSVRRVGPR